MRPFTNLCTNPFLPVSMDSISSSSRLNKIYLLIFHMLFIVPSSPNTNFAVLASPCKRLNSIISFGDSLADTGNLLHLTTSNSPPHFAVPPYGETYFHTPTGRFSNGRLIIDFLAEYLGIPLVPPYTGSRYHRSSANNFSSGLNFAVAGATALDNKFFEQRGVNISAVQNFPLGTQLGWFKEVLPSLCHTASDCEELFKRSVVLMGEIGGNDYNHALLAGVNKELVQTFVPHVVGRIASALTELLELGAKSIVVPGDLPIGCSPAFLTHYMNSSKQDYDPKTGCLIWLNEFAEYHNKMLQAELNKIQKRHPHAKIIYADYYNAVMPLYISPIKLGFSNGALKACCGGKGAYHYNSNVECGKAPSTACPNPALYVNWDGLHLTEATYNFIFKRLFKGPLMVPPFRTLCTV